jgi:hypothetical protein
VGLCQARPPSPRYGATSPPSPERRWTGWRTGRRLFFEIWQKRWGAREPPPAAGGVPPKAFDLGDASQKVNRFAAGASRRDADWKRPGRSRSRFSTAWFRRRPQAPVTVSNGMDTTPPRRLESGLGGQTGKFCRSANPRPGWAAAKTVKKLRSWRVGVA